MKKIIVFAILWVLCVTLIACDTDASPVESEEMTTISDVGLTEEEMEHHVKVETEEQDKETEPAGCEHKIVTEPEVPATCVADGMTKSRYCSKCGESFEDAEVIPALGHQKAEDTDNCKFCHKNYWVCVAEEKVSIKLNVYKVGSSQNTMCDIYVVNETDHTLVFMDHLSANGESFGLESYSRPTVKPNTSGNTYFYLVFAKSCYLDNESIADGWFKMDGNRVHFKCNTKGDVVFASSYNEVKNMVLGE